MIQNSMDKTQEEYPVFKVKQKVRIINTNILCTVKGKDNSNRNDVKVLLHIDKDDTPRYFYKRQGIYVGKLSKLFLKSLGNNKDIKEIKIDRELIKIEDRVTCLELNEFKPCKIRTKSIKDLTDLFAFQNPYQYPTIIKVERPTYKDVLVHKIVKKEKAA